MEITKNGKKVRDVKTREEGILFIAGKVRLLGEQWAIRHQGKVLFKLGGGTWIYYSTVKKSKKSVIGRME